MDAKQILRDTRSKIREVAELQRHLSVLKKSVLPGGIRYDIDKVQSSTSDKITEKFAEIGDLEAELEQEIRDLTTDIYRAHRMIQSLSSPEQRRVLRAYYLPHIDAEDYMDDLPSWLEVARSLHYSEAHIHRLHGNALQALNKNESK